MIPVYCGILPHVLPFQEFKQFLLNYTYLYYLKRDSYRIRSKRFLGRGNLVLWGWEGRSWALEGDTFTNSIREHFSLGGGGDVGLGGIPWDPPPPPLIVHEIVEPWQPPGVLSDDCPVFLKFRSSTIIILCHGLTNSHHIDCPYLPENIGYQYIG